MRHPAMVFLAAFAAALPARAAEKPWTEIRSPRFTVVSDAGERRTREVAADFERARALARALAPWLPEDGRERLVVVAKSAKARKRFDPRSREAVHVAGRDRDWTVMLLAAASRWGSARHYASHVDTSLERRFGDRMPLWLREGLVDIVATAKIRGGEAEVGHVVGAYLAWFVLDAAQAAMRETGKKRVAVAVPPVEAIVPPSRLVVARRRAATDADPGARAQSWAFVHFLMFGERGAHRAKFDRVGTLLAEGVPAHEAVRQALGDLAALDETYRDYVRAARFHFERFALSGGDPTAWAARPVPAREVTELAASFRSDAAAECARLAVSCPDLER